jgi:hypothetical protein
MGAPGVARCSRARLGARLGARLLLPAVLCLCLAAAAAATVQQGGGGGGGGDDEDSGSVSHLLRKRYEPAPLPAIPLPATPLPATPLPATPLPATSSPGAGGGGGSGGILYGGGGDDGGIFYGGGGGGDDFGVGGSDAEDLRANAKGVRVVRAMQSAGAGGGDATERKGLAAIAEVCASAPTVGRCRLTVSKPVLKACLVSALETKM